jgi:hypothetical protein
VIPGERLFLKLYGKEEIHDMVPGESLCPKLYGREEIQKVGIVHMSIAAAHYEMDS